MFISSHSYRVRDKVVLRRLPVLAMLLAATWGSVSNPRTLGIGPLTFHSVDNRCNWRNCSELRRDRSTRWQVKVSSCLVAPIEQCGHPLSHATPFQRIYEVDAWQTMLGFPANSASNVFIHLRKTSHLCQWATCTIQTHRAHRSKPQPAAAPQSPTEIITLLYSDNSTLLREAISSQTLDLFYHYKQHILRLISSPLPAEYLAYVLQTILKQNQSTLSWQNAFWIATALHF